MARSIHTRMKGRKAEKFHKRMLELSRDDHTWKKGRHAQAMDVIRQLKLLDFCVSEMTFLDQFVLIKYYNLNRQGFYSYQQLADILCVTRERVRQILSGALIKIDNEIRDEDDCPI